MNTAAVAISPDAQTALIALAEQGELMWRSAAAVVERELSASALPRMAVYQAAAACLGAKASAVRSWVGLHRAVGDDLLDEFPQFRISHWRLLKRHARAMRQPLAELAIQWAATADDYGGLPIPPDALAAKINGRAPDDDPYRRALDRAERALASALRHAPSRKRPAVEGLARQLEKLSRSAKVAQAGAYTE